MIKLYIGLIASLFLTILAGLIIIPVLRKIKFGQPILKYVETHKGKSGTPTMGGLFFIIPSMIIFIILGGLKSKISLVTLIIGLAFLIVGFIDDFIKVKLKRNEGLKAYQKIIFQTAISIFAGLFCYYNGLTVFYIPYTEITCDLSYFTVPVVAIIFVAITNSVNLTDGIDGLAGSCSIGYLIIISVLIILEYGITVFNFYTDIENEVLLTVCLIGGIIGFLFFNVNKAKVFMGDTGSLSLGGLIGAISVFTKNSFFIPIIGIMFVISSISVIIQVVHYKRTKKRVFLMAPYHHHLELKGLSESKIVFIYTIITLIIGSTVIVRYLV